MIGPGALSYDFANESFQDVIIPQGFHNIIVELWAVSTSLLGRRHKLAHRIIDVNEVVIPRRYVSGCVINEAFSLAPCGDGSSESRGVVVWKCSCDLFSFLVIPNALPIPMLRQISFARFQAGWAAEADWARCSGGCVG